jgi:hypothetical protein
LLGSFGNASWIAHIGDPMMALAAFRVRDTVIG